MPAYFVSSDINSEIASQCRWKPNSTVHVARAALIWKVPIISGVKKFQGNGFNWTSAKNAIKSTN
jgi:hypothetical protein